MKAKQYLQRIQIKNKQRAINKAYEKHGLTDEILQAQIELNKKRHEHNISDSDKRVHENYVQ